MEYYITRSASVFYPTPIDQVVWRVDTAVDKKLKIFLDNLCLGCFYDSQEQLDIPIFFITDADLGEFLPKDNFTVINKRYLTKKAVCKTAISIPDKILIPSKHDFNYKAESIERLIGGLGEMTDEEALHALQNPNYGLMNLNEEVVTSSDWLGLYCGYHTRYRCIFIRIDEIMKEPLLCNAIGVASVVFHELGHALMDSLTHVSSAYYLKFRNRVNPFVANLIKYTLEEALANLIAYKCICGPSPYEKNAIEFMRSKQPFPYSLGPQLGSAKTESPFGLVREIQRYIEHWYKAKDGKIIEDFPGWVKLIFSKPSFNVTDLRVQWQTLFLPKKTITGRETRRKPSKGSLGDSEKEKSSPDKSAKVTSGEPKVVDVKNLRPQSEDPFGREGVMIGGVYKPFKYGYINRNERFVIAPRFDEADFFSDDLVPGYGPLARVQEKGKWGIIKPDGSYLIEPIFDVIRDFSEGFAAVKIDHTFYADWGFIKPNGSYLVEPLFEKVEDFKNGYAEVKTSNNARLFTLPGGKCVLKSFDDICDTITDETEFDDENIVGKRYGEKKGFVDTNGFWYDKKPRKNC